MYSFTVTFQSQLDGKLLWALTSSGLLVNPPRSYDCLDDGHMTAVARRRSGRFRFSYFNFDGFSHFSLEPTVFSG